MQRSTKGRHPQSEAVRREFGGVHCNPATGSDQHRAAESPQCIEVLYKQRSMSYLPKWRKYKGDVLGPGPALRQTDHLQGIHLPHVRTQRL